MPISRRNILLLVAGFSAFLFIQVKSGKSRRLYPGDNSISQLNLSDHEWKQRLDDNAYQVLRLGQTENRYSSPLNKETRQGRYHCKACNLPLFESHMKYDNHTGWLVLKIIFSAISALILISNHSPQQELIVVFSAGGIKGIC